MDRRGFLKAIVGVGVAPAYVKADSLMKVFVPARDIILPEQGIICPATSNRLMTIEEITREALKILERNLVTTKGIIWQE